MTLRYDDSVAAHYAAYRPPLHQVILRRALSDERRAVGLDIGCGTGASAVALAEHSLRVYGLDPSQPMLRKSTPHQRVRYVAGAAEHIPLAGRTVDVVTFAGSLFYVKRHATADELKRICSPGALVLVYDFEVLLTDFLRRFGLEDAGQSDYDHSVGFSGTPGFAELTVGRERVSVQTTASELGHVLLADAQRAEHLARRYRVADPFPPLLSDLRGTLESTTIHADIHYSKYRLASV